MSRGISKVWPLALLGLVLPAASTAQTPGASAGEVLYLSDCAACHQPKGEGIPGPFPALAGNRLVVGPPDALIATVLLGRGGMPAFKSELSDQDIAAMLSFVRGAWGNQAPPVTASDVAGLRTKAAEAQPRSLQTH
jgi:mono/diheme cytochrome c family protein